MKKFLAYLVLGCVSLNTQILAETYDQWDVSPQNNTWENSENSRDWQSTNNHGYEWDSNSCCYEQNNCGTFEVGADWLYWKAEEGQMEFGANVTTADGGSTISSTVLRPKFKETSGYRVFANYETPDNAWNFGAIYSHLPSNTNLSVNDNLTVALDAIVIFNPNFPIFSAISSAAFDSVDAHWDLDVDYADLDLSRTFTLCESLQICPNIGLRGFWLHQTFDLDGAGTTISFTSSLKGKVEAYGLKGGLTGIGKLGYGFSIVGHVGGSLLYARLHNSGELTGVVPGSPDTHISYRDTMHKAMPTIDSSIGIHYTHMLWNKKIDLHACWENHIVFGTNAFAIGAGANLTMQGLTLGGSVDF